MIESIRIWLQLIETVLDWQLVMDWGQSPPSSGSIIKWWSLGAGNFLFITPRHTHTLVSFSTGDMFRFFRLFWRGGEIIFCKMKKMQEYGACEMQILQIGDRGWKQTGSIMRQRCLWDDLDKLDSIRFAEKWKCFLLPLKLDKTERSLNKEKYCCICMSGLEDAFP